MINIGTDTATICIFDTTALSHRKDDIGDWWSLPQDEMAEINLGNVIFVNLGSDGVYEVEINAGVIEGGEVYELKIPSGRVFIGPGEEVSAGGFEPDGKWGGEFVALAPGNYRCSLRRSENRVTIGLVP